MKCQEALIEFSHLLLVGSAALESVIDHAPTGWQVTARLTEIRAIAERLRDIGHEIERIGAEEAN